jgi:hypothetical protein
MEVQPYSKEVAACAAPIFSRVVGTPAPDMFFMSCGWGNWNSNTEHEGVTHRNALFHFHLS